MDGSWPQCFCTTPCFKVTGPELKGLVVLVRAPCVLLMACAVLGGCDHGRDSDSISQADAGAPAISSRLSPQDRIVLQSPQAAAAPLRNQAAELHHQGTGSFIRAPSTIGPSVAGNGDEFTFNFVNADVADVAKAILGDILHLSYVVDGSVQGSVTLRTSRPLARADILNALEASLRLSGIALVRHGDSYRIVALAEANRGGNTGYTVSNGTPSVGYGIEVIPLHYVSAQDMLHLLGPLSASEGQIKVDEARNLLIVSGTGQERAAIADSVALFDVNYMAGMSFSLFHLREASASAVAAELSQIMAGKGGPMEGLVRFVVIDRLNSILAVTAQPRYLDQVRGWINQLDQVGRSDERRVFVYSVQNGRASDLAAVLSHVLGASGDRGGSGAGGPGGAPSTQGGGLSQGGSGGLGSGTGGGGLSESAQPASTGAANPLLGPVAGSSGSETGQRNDGPRVTADEINNAILIYGTAAEYHNLQDTLLRLDVPPMQVMLEAAIAEVDLNRELSFGIQYSFQNGHNLLSTVANSAVTATAPSLAYTLSLSQNIKATLDALSTITKVNVISAPKVLVLNNQPAQLEVGNDVPITTQSAQSTSSAGAPIVNSITYRETGVILRVTPRVNQSGLVQMDVSQEVSDVAQTSSSAVSPTFTQRKISSTVSVQDGETIALGGLITDSRSKSTNAIPILSQIPYLGQLFSQRDNTVSRTELLVLITPHVVQSVQRLRAVTEELRRHMIEVQQLLQH